MNTVPGQTGPFEKRHNGVEDKGFLEMLKALSVKDINELIDQTVPAAIRSSAPLQLPSPLDEGSFLKMFKDLAAGNVLCKNYIGMGYYNTITPTVVLRNILENPAWYTAYTPYQAEISQGRLEALINYQTMVCDLTGMELANASLLDEGTAAAEAMSMLLASRKGAKKSAQKFLMDKNIFPQTMATLETRAIPLGIELVSADLLNEEVPEEGCFGAIVQYPDSNGNVPDLAEIIKKTKSREVPIIAISDLLALVLLEPPGRLGADIVVGSSQRFGVPMGYGGPHAAFLATREEHKRLIPGRVIGVSLDSQGNKAYRMALQTREQHIKRERATSNICTAQVLLAVMAGMYAVYHGSEGLGEIARRVHARTVELDHSLRGMGFQQVNTAFFDTLKIKTDKSEEIRKEAERKKINFRYFDDGQVGISLDETTTTSDLQDIIEIFRTVSGIDERTSDGSDETKLPRGLERTDSFLTHPVFNSYQTEHEMLRYMKRLENKDLSLVHSMISLGSCTMKLNATTEMIPVTWPEFGAMHPFAPVEQAAGYQRLFNDLENWLCEITGFDKVSLQPNSGAQGEYAGLMVIRAWHESRAEGHRNIVLVPSSAHGTNPASAVMAGYKTLIVPCDERGNIDVSGLKSLAETNATNLAGLMITYPSTHGVYEEEIIEICDIIHKYGGQVYMDGANLNAQVGLTSPKIIGADVCHLNLHKTFCIPHGGGGPGMGPIGVAEHLAPFLPGNPVVKTGGEKGISAISAAPWGSAGILPISYAYIAMMGAEGLTNASKRAILNANYLKVKLEEHYPVLYTGSNGRCAHEMIIDCRDFKKAGIEVEDIAKRLMDYGYHAPTVSFPVPGTLMIEPTESEVKEELDRFCDAMTGIREEIREIEEGKADREDNVLKNAPHTVKMVTTDQWERPYSREKAAWPRPWVGERKFWPSVGRIDNAYGDRNLFCSCVPVEDV